MLVWTWVCRPSSYTGPQLRTLTVISEPMIDTSYTIYSTALAWRVSVCPALLGCDRDLDSMHSSGDQQRQCWCCGPNCLGHGGGRIAGAQVLRASLDNAKTPVIRSRSTQFWRSAMITFPEGFLCSSLQCPSQACVTWSLNNAVLLLSAVHRWGA